LVVAGDPHQLPPTQFFAADRDEGHDREEAQETEGFESILDVMATFLPQWQLEWHYRSRDERLIAFSNHHVYGGRLVTFPAASSETPVVSHVLVEQGGFADADGRLPYRFGPLLVEGGHRRLNVAVTRARQRITLVSSFSHLDMDPARSGRRGVELLRRYLEYAASGGRSSAAAETPVAPPGE